jgi:Cys-tRNA(Pro)/Cys-tRNA(Cys) deacylase
MMVKKTQAMRILVGEGVEFEVFEYDPNLRDAAEVAKSLNVPGSQVFKTLVVVNQNRKPILVMVPSDKQLNLKRLAKVVGQKKVKMASQKEAEMLTGLQVGGISALALLNRGFAIYLDESAEKINRIIVSAGQRGLQLRLPVADLVRITQATWVSDI